MYRAFYRNEKKTFYEKWDNPRRIACHQRCTNLFDGRGWYPWVHVLRSKEVAFFRIGGRKRKRGDYGGYLARSTIPIFLDGETHIRVENFYPKVW